ncbi:MAG: urease accessory protein UreD [Actinomycetota bacterium]
MRTATSLRLGPSALCAATGVPGSSPAQDRDRLRSSRSCEIVDARCEPPFLVRRSGERVVFAASAAAPVGGDDLTLHVGIDPGAWAKVGTVGATMLLPGAAGRSSTMTTEIDVGCDARLDWWPEPTVSVHRSDHRAATLVRLDSTAQATVVEEFVLGRTGEAPGRLSTSLRVEVDGVVRVHHGEMFGPDVPGWGSVVSVGAARHVLTAVVVDPAGLGSTDVDSVAPVAVGDGPDVFDEVARVGGVAAARLPIDPCTCAVLVVADDRPAALSAAAVHGIRRS